MISILMAAHGGIEYIEEAVASVMNQTVSDWELLIGVNGFTKQSNEYKNAETFVSDKIHVYDQFYVKNKADCLNELMSFARGTIICILDVDDIWEPNKLQVQLQYMTQYHIVGSFATYIGNKSGQYYTIPGDLSNFNFFSGNPIVNSSSMFRRNCGTFWRNTHCEDYDMWLRFYIQGYKFFNITENLIKYRVRDNALSTNGEAVEKSVQEIRNYYSSVKI